MSAAMERAIAELELIAQSAARTIVNAGSSAPDRATLLRRALPMIRDPHLLRRDDLIVHLEARVDFLTRNRGKWWCEGDYLIGAMQALEAELKRMVARCEGGRIADCRVIEVLADQSHAHCLDPSHGADLGEVKLG